MMVLYFLIKMLLLFLVASGVQTSNFTRDPRLMFLFFVSRNLEENSQKFDSFFFFFYFCRDFFKK